MEPAAGHARAAAPRFGRPIDSGTDKRSGGGIPSSPPLSACGTNAMCRYVRLHGEYWRVSGPPTDIRIPALMACPSEREVAADLAIKAWYRPLPLHGVTPREGRIGNLHSTARIHCHAWRRGGSVAARGAGSTIG